MGSYSSLRWDVFLTKPQENKDINSHFCNKGTSERLCRGWVCERLCEKKTHMHYLLPACVLLLLTAQTKLKAHSRELSLMRKRWGLSQIMYQYHMSNHQFKSFIYESSFHKKGTRRHKSHIFLVVRSIRKNVTQLKLPNHENKLVLTFTFSLSKN